MRMMTTNGHGSEDPSARRVFYLDWHRVERALALFRLRVSELRERGWLEVRP
jgi:hypothetical protein